MESELTSRISSRSLLQLSGHWGPVKGQYMTGFPPTSPRSQSYKFLWWLPYYKRIKGRSLNEVHHIEPTPTLCKHTNLVPLEGSQKEAWTQSLYAELHQDLLAVGGTGFSENPNVNNYPISCRLLKLTGYCLIIRMYSRPFRKFVILRETSKSTFRPQRNSQTYIWTFCVLEPGSWSYLTFKTC